LNEKKVDRIKDFSILSFRRNVMGTNKSDWIDGIFGSKAIFYERTGSAFVEKNVTLSRNNFENFFQLPSYVSRSECSFELLGYVALNRAPPFEMHNRGSLIIGDAKMSLTGSSSTWNCFYRPMYETWRNNRSFWQIFFYCPAHDNTMCTSNSEMKPGQNLDGDMVFQIQNTMWKSVIFLKSKLRHGRPKKVEGEENTVVQKITYNQPAACLAIPYESSDRAKVITNGAMIFEWVRYHALMGFKVYVFDKGGANRKRIFNSNYGKMQKQRDMSWVSNVVYRPYTVYGRLETLNSQLTFDSSFLNDTDRAMQRRLEYLDNDKTATLTKCRFDASSVHGADNVIVADFDEFLFCPGAATTFAGQEYFVSNLISKYRSQGYGELVFVQMWAAAKLYGGKYTSPRDCLIDMVRKGETIFNCFTGYKHNAGVKFVGKTLHLGHICPLTDFHTSCQSGDCTCPSLYGGENPYLLELPVEERCYLIHLSTNIKDYKYHVFDNETRTEFERESSELIQLLESADYPTITRHETRPGRQPENMMNS
jgi:hypothetical protein